MYQNDLVTACDMPLLNTDFIKCMVSVAGGFDAVVPRVGFRSGPFCAVYLRRCVVGIDRFDKAHLCFMNINMQADLVQAEGLLGRS